MGLYVIYYSLNSTRTEIVALIRLSPSLCPGEEEGHEGHGT